MARSKPELLYPRKRKKAASSRRSPRPKAQLQNLRVRLVSEFPALGIVWQGDAERRCVPRRASCRDCTARARDMLPANSLPLTITRTKIQLDNGVAIVDYLCQRKIPKQSVPPCNPSDASWSAPQRLGILRQGWRRTRCLTSM